jgi:hypothetical protein
MPELWTDDEQKPYEVRDIDPMVPLAIIAVLVTALAIAAIWMWFS